MMETFKQIDIGITKDRVRVDWVNLGEGLCGDYDPDDPEDVNLLRFDVYEWCAEDNEWYEPQDSSYCTQVPADTPEPRLYELLQIIMGEVHEPLMNGHSVKRICERLSWMDERGCGNG
jgi:hypothetical protein